MRSSSSGTAVKSNRRRLYLEDCTTKGSYLRDVIKHLLLLTLVIFPLCYSTFSSSLSSSSVPPSLPTKNGWNKQTDRLIRKAGLFILQACNWCTETFAVNCILDLPLCFYFLLQIPPCSPFLPDGFQCDTVAHTDETPCCLTLPRAGCGRYKWNIDIYHSVELTRHTVSAIHYCEKVFLFLLTVILGLNYSNYWPRVCVCIILCFWCRMVDAFNDFSSCGLQVISFT